MQKTGGGGGIGRYRDANSGLWETMLKPIVLVTKYSRSAGHHLQHCRILRIPWKCQRVLSFRIMNANGTFEALCQHVLDMQYALTANPKPKTPNPKPKTLNLKPITLKPKPCNLPGNM